MKDYAGYILAAYGFAALIVGGLTLKITLDYRELRKRLERFNDRGDGS